MIIVFFHLAGKVFDLMHMLNKKRNSGKRILADVLNRDEDRPFIPEFLCFSIFLISNFNSSVEMSLNENSSTGIKGFEVLIKGLLLFLSSKVSEVDKGLMSD